MKDVALAAGLVEPEVETLWTRILLVSAACSGMYKTLRRWIESDAHILLHLRICATVTPYLSATPARESVGRTSTNQIYVNMGFEYDNKVVVSIPYAPKPPTHPPLHCLWQPAAFPARPSSQH